jgi:hypothetical protein
LRATLPDFPAISLKQKMKMNYDKQDCIDSITRALEGAATWRKNTAVRFSDDSRNIRAAETLERLAANAANLTDENWQELSPHFSSSDAWRKGLSQTSRQVGFWHRAKNLDAFVNVLAHNLSSVAA